MATSFQNLQRPAMADEIRNSVAEGKRVILLGPHGSGKLSLVKEAFPHNAVVCVDLKLAVNQRLLDSLKVAPGGAPVGLRNYLGEVAIAAQKHNGIVVIRDIDASSGSKWERECSWYLRNELQHISKIPIIYTAHDEKFLGRNVGDPRSPFFKQATIIEVPPLDDSLVAEWLRSNATIGASTGLAGAFIACGGRRIGNLAVLLKSACECRNQLHEEMLQGRSKNRKPQLVVTDVLAGANKIAASRHVIYSALLSHQIPSNWKAVLLALNQGEEPKASRNIAKITGMKMNDVSSVLRGLRAHRILFEEAGRTVFFDPFFKAYLGLQ